MSDCITLEAIQQRYQDDITWAESITAKTARSRDDSDFKHVKRLVQCVRALEELGKSLT